MRATDVGTHLGSVSGRAASADLWYAQVGDHATDVARFTEDCLSADERARVASYRSREAAERYVITRSLARTVLGERLGARARDLVLGRTDGGKPTTRGIHFNISHSGDLILVAISAERDVGVDVERRRPVERVEALVARWFTPAERADLARLTASGLEQSDAFLQVWSIKEARLKALGVGISGAPTARVESLDVVSLRSLFESLPRGRDERGYVGALAFA